MVFFAPRQKATRVTRRIVGATILGVLGTATLASAHDFWIIPDLFAFETNATMVVNGRQGGEKFPAGTAVPAERVVDARIIGASSTTSITEMVVEGSSLKLRQKPTAPGQYLIVVGLAPRVNRQTPTGVIRFLKAEGGVAEAERLEREQTFAGLDSVIFTSASYAASVAEVGAGGPRAFSKTGGLRLTFVPLTDPSHLHVGDTLRVQLVGNDQPLAGRGVEVATGLVSGAGPTATVTRITFTTDAKGIAYVPLTKAGPVMLRSAFASPKAGGAKTEWDVSRTTYVFHVDAGH